jgi:hypothetical protein
MKLRLHRLLAQIMVNAKDRRLGEKLQQRRVQRACRGQIAPERLLHHESCAVRGPRTAEQINHDRKHGRRNGEVIKRSLRGAQRLFQCFEGRRLAVVAVDVLQQCRQALHRRRLGRFDEGLQALVHMRDELLARPTGTCDTNHRNFQLLAQHQMVERRKYLARAQIAGGAKNHQSIGSSVAHQDLLSW